MGSFGDLAALVARVIASNGVPAGHVGVLVDYSFRCYSCSKEWEATTTTTDCPACGTTNNHCAANPRGVAPAPQCPKGCGLMGTFFDGWRCNHCGETARGVAPAAPMQGLAAYLRAEASALERSYLSPKDAPHDNIDTLRQWAIEVDGAAGVPSSPKPQAWTDPEKEPRFQPGEET